MKRHEAGSSSDYDVVRAQALVAQVRSTIPTLIGADHEHSDPHHHPLSSLDCDGRRVGRFDAAIQLDACIEGAVSDVVSAVNGPALIAVPVAKRSTSPSARLVSPVTEVR